MDFMAQAYNTKFVTTSGSGVIGVSGQPVYLQAIYNGQASAQAIFLFTNIAAATLVFCTLPARSYLAFPAAAPNGLIYQTASNPGDADIRLVFFWTPG